MKQIFGNSNLDSQTGKRQSGGLFISDTCSPVNQPALLYSRGRLMIRSDMPYAAKYAAQNQLLFFQGFFLQFVEFCHAFVHGCSV